jgi:hypothetical protein
MKKDATNEERKQTVFKRCDDSQYHELLAAYAALGMVPRFTPHGDGYACDFLQSRRAAKCGTVKVRGRIVQNWVLS